MNQRFVAWLPFDLTNKALCPGTYAGSVLRMIYALSTRIGHKSSFVEWIICVGRSVTLWFLVLGNWIVANVWSQMYGLPPCRILMLLSSGFLLRLIVSEEGVRPTGLSRKMRPETLPKITSHLTRWYSSSSVCGVGVLLSRVPFAVMVRIYDSPLWSLIIVLWVGRSALPSTPSDSSRGGG